MNNYTIQYTDEYLAHHGILGQKWGVRRFQNEDGSLTAAGAKRYGSVESKKQALSDKAGKYGGTITNNGKYKASNGVVIAKSNNKAIAGMRRFSTTLVGRALGAAGTSKMAKITGRTKESINEQSRKELQALKEYYKVGGDNMLKKYGKLQAKAVSIDTITKGAKTASDIINELSRDTSGKTIRDRIADNNNKYRKPTIEEAIKKQGPRI